MVAPIVTTLWALDIARQIERLGEGDFTTTALAAVLHVSEDLAFSILLGWELEAIVTRQDGTGSRWRWA